MVLVRLSAMQRQLYQFYLAKVAPSDANRKGAMLFEMEAALSKIWTHPDALLLAAEEATEAKARQEERREMESFLVDNSDEVRRLYLRA